MVANSPASPHLMAGGLADGADSSDMYAVDLAAKVWRNVTGGLQGVAPSSRAYHAMATAGQTVYLFGGSHPAGETRAAAGNVLQKCAATRHRLESEDVGVAR